MKILSIIVTVFLLFFISMNQFTFSKEEIEYETIQIEVKGYVENPGIYTIKAYSTIQDLLEIITIYDDTELSTINQLQILKNDDIIVFQQITTTPLISINAATLQQLCTLKGIGPSLAQRIIDDRNENGPFNSLEEIKRVKGIGDNKFEQIKDFICL